MTLATHAIVGAAAAQLFPTHPIIAFSAGFVSHFLLDMIPHWDYKILSTYANPDSAMQENKYSPGASQRHSIDRLFIYDLIRTGLDTTLGFIVVGIMFFLGVFVTPQIIILGALGGIIPDFLQLVYNRFPYQPVTLLQTIHHRVHAESRPFEDKPVTGILTQIIVVGLCLTVFFFIFTH